MHTGIPICKRTRVKAKNCVEYHKTLLNYCIWGSPYAYGQGALLHTGRIGTKFAYGAPRMHTEVVCMWGITFIQIHMLSGGEGGHHRVRASRCQPPPSCCVVRCPFASHCVLRPTPLVCPLSLLLCQLVVDCCVASKMVIAIIVLASLIVVAIAVIALAFLIVVLPLLLASWPSLHSCQHPYCTGVVTIVAVVSLIAKEAQQWRQRQCDEGLGADATTAKMPATEAT
jgi:hypothetical protein